MAFNYNKLWKLLIDKGIKKDELRQKIGVSSSTIAKMGKNENVSLDVIDKICKLFNCQPNDIMQYIPSNIKEGE